MNGDLVVGIDLGTTNSCVSIFRKEQLEILNNREGHYITPSYVFIGVDSVVVGKHAKRMAANKAELGIYEVKRFIGRQFHEVQGVQNLDDLSFVIKNDSGRPTVFIEMYDKFLTPEEITTFILQKMKDDATAKLGQEVTKAVITVPAHFNVSQRKATLHAAQDAGFSVLKLLSEPTAAALNYFYEVGEDYVEGEYSLVYDLGGGTFDVSIVQRQNQNINVIAVDGDSDLGGKDFDTLISDYIITKLQSKFEINLDKRTLRRLKNESEMVKETLSSGTSAPLILEGIFNVDVVEEQITRQEFEAMSKHLFKRSMDVVERCITNSGLEKSDIVKIILAGGSTRIPKIQELLEEYFDGILPTKILHPEECVAKGAALQAAMLSKHPDQTLKHFTIREVTSSSLGIGDFVQRMNFIIRKNTPTPTSSSVTHATVSDQQKAIYFQVFEGERMDSRKNVPLGRLEINNLTPAPPGKCHVTVTMHIDENGILDITAQEKLSSNTRTLEIALMAENRENISINRSLDERQNKVEDEQFAEFADKKNYLLVYCTTVKYNLKRLKLLDTYEDVFERCRSISRVVTKLELEDADQLMTLGSEIIDTCRPLIINHRFIDMPDRPHVEFKFTKHKLTGCEKDCSDEEWMYGTIPVREKKLFSK